MAGLVSRARVCPGGTKYGAVDSPGDHNFGRTIDSVTDPMSAAESLEEVYLSDMSAEGKREQQALMRGVFVCVARL